jgi:hypothetical protein
MKNIVASGAHQLEQRKAFGEQVQKETAQIRQLQSQLLAVHNAVNPAWKALQSGKLQDAFLELASAGGKSRLEVKRELRDSYIPVVAEYLGINQQWVEERLRAPELRDWHDKIRTKEENQFLKEEQERIKNAPPPQQQTKGVSPGIAAMKRFQAEHGFKDATIKEAVRLCKESGEINGKEGDFPAQIVANKVLVLNAVDRGVDAILAIKPSLAENPKFVDSVVEVIKTNPSIGNVELAKVVRKRAKKFARREAEKLTRDVSRKALRGKDQTSLQAPNKSMPGRQVMSFRDLPTDDLV